jgi:hypothetical protein
MCSSMVLDGVMFGSVINSTKLSSHARLHPGRYGQMPYEGHVGTYCWISLTARIKHIEAWAQVCSQHHTSRSR